ncbi:Fur family transcriptional regulator [Abyssicoccus albus]|uniref:Fur family zinc uptake regulator n=1 Tax=Abyssicoccus albus TaxID=1817405 RepID=A0A1Q1G151_9BACL|nr:Fur family transcriptional regulator [Abyssicoccus albus]AQL56074.1 transcriptional repressor [Abyssicoccus albus]RPF58114.1 Fur family zinc uptake regulator [Abyssicoccus albus]
MQVEAAIKLLKDEGYKYTDKRKDIISFFNAHDKYISAKDLQLHLDKKYPGISFDTIYRNLYLFHDLNIIEQTEFNGEMKYRISCSDHHHHHFICTECGKTKVIHFCPMDEWQKELPDVEIDSHKIELFGKCKNCNA